MSRVRRLPLALLIAGLSGAPSVPFAEDGPAFDFVEPAPWKEGRADLPAYPDGSHYVEAPADIAGSNLRMFVDEPSLTIGEDGVVRYVLLLRSPTGTENLFYEGIRCSTREWRTYAYGTTAGTWGSQGDTPWRRIRDRGVERYRLQLYQYYLCDPVVGPRTRRDMLQRLRYGVPAHDLMGLPPG